MIGVWFNEIKELAFRYRIAAWQVHLRLHMQVAGEMALGLVGTYYVFVIFINVIIAQ